MNDGVSVFKYKWIYIDTEIHAALFLKSEHFQSNFWI